MGGAGQPAYLVVANIPYYITSALVRHLLETSFPPQSLVLTVQREVAERICAAPGEMSLLALSVQVYGSPQIVARIPAGAFYPPPKVNSAVIRVELYASPFIPQSAAAGLFQTGKSRVFSETKNAAQRLICRDALVDRPDR